LKGLFLNTNKDDFPLWKGEIKLRYPSDQFSEAKDLRIEYKYVITDDKGFVFWEPFS
jgi:hypothetical protein